MLKQQPTGIAYTSLPGNLQIVEKEKSRLILEAHTLKSQNRFAEAAEYFAQAAQYEQELANWATAQGLNDLSYLHSFSALSCWAQAGDPHRALTISRTLLRSGKLTQPQRTQLQAYYDTLEQRWVSWMNQWVHPAFAAG
jgi:hypothetical protein